ncbi:hypothetical protein EJB05_50858, partial [Eragrostis curvula]
MVLFTEKKQDRRLIIFFSRARRSMQPMISLQAKSYHIIFVVVAQLRLGVVEPVMLLLTQGCSVARDNKIAVLMESHRSEAYAEENLMKTVNKELRDLT